MSPYLYIQGSGVLPEPPSSLVTPYMMHHLQHIQICRCQISNYGLMDQTRQVSESRGPHKPCVVVRSFLFKSQEPRVLGVASMGLQKPHPTMASHTSLSIFNLISPLI